MGVLKTLADKVWKEGRVPPNERVRQFTDQVDTLVGAGTLEAARSTGQELDGAVDFAEIAEPSAPAADYLRVFAVDDQGFGVLETKNGSGRVFRLGQDTYRIVRNTSGATLTAGQVVYFAGSTGNKPNVALAKADSSTTMPAVGMVGVPFDDNDFGIIIVIGKDESINTASFTEGDELFVSPTTAGAVTNVRPTHPDFAQAIGTVEVSGVGNGSILVNVAPFKGGHESGTVLNEFAIGDGLSGAKDLAFVDNTGRYLLRYSSGALTMDGSLVYQRDNILGTVSQSGGVPTGAIIEEGSNANGDYVRYADGTQICWVNGIVATGSGSVASAEVTWTFPIAFVDTAYVVNVTPSNHGAQWVNVTLTAISFIFGNTSTTTTTCNVGVRFASNMTDPEVTLYAHAIGRWF